jgi:hypothetical protein
MKMALELVKALARTELDDNLHMARLLLLLAGHAGRTNKPMDGVTKLAKLDFMLRYPNCFERALAAKGLPTESAQVQDYERSTIESKMVRFRYGPWDHRYRRWIALLAAKRLVHVAVEGRTVKLWLTDAGHEAAKAFVNAPELDDIGLRARLVAKEFGSMSGSQLTSFVYETFPEISSMRWGDPIKL